jgi:hypothetical protein
MWRHARVVLGYEADMHLAAEGSSAAADVHWIEVYAWNARFAPRRSAVTVLMIHF